MYPQKKKKIKLLFLRNYHQIIEKSPIETQILVPERHVSKSFLSRSLKENSLYQSFSVQKKNYRIFTTKQIYLIKIKKLKVFNRKIDIKIFSEKKNQLNFNI